MSDLAPLLANRRWMRMDYPFPHLRAMNVFQPAVYQEMAAAYQELLDRGFGGSDDPDRFSRSIEGYDVYALTLRPHLPRPLQVFMSRAWHDLLAGVAGVRGTGDVNGSMHHHPPGSLSGRPHNDLNPGWFPGEEAPPGEVTLIDPRRCSYFSGETFGEDAGKPARETVRGVACLFYLNNPPWRPGDGGETGLYVDADSRTESPADAMPPINNSVLVFECTPRSYHAFIRNNAGPRNSIVLWIHRRKDEVVARWGERSIIGWGGARVLNEVPAR